MKTYRVTLKVVDYHKYDVEADNACDAEDKAEELFDEGETSHLDIDYGTAEACPLSTVEVEA